MTASFVQSAIDNSVVSQASLAPTLAAPSTTGNLLVLYYASGDNGTFPGISTPAGWTATLSTALTNGGVPSRYSRIWHKISAGETSVTLTPTSNYTGAAILVEYDLDGASIADYGAVARTGGSAGSGLAFWTDFGGNGLEPDAGSPVILGFGGADSVAGGEVLPASSTQREIGDCSVGEGAAYADRIIASASPPYVLSESYNNMFYANVAAFWQLTTAIAPVADFTADLTTIIEGGTVAFTDTSTNTPTSWAWDFGDGDTSTSQNLNHVYDAPGTYTVSLTATNAFGSDTETKVSYISVLTDTEYEDPPPAGAILEIYASDPGSARWDVAKWDEDEWGEGGWQDVTGYGIDVEILWGSDRPELGILTVPRPASWGIHYHDPDRILDPANEDGPYFGDLLPGLPVRLSHRGIVVRQGTATGITHSYADPQEGHMRVADLITTLANAQVPSDTELSDTLYARAVDAIAAAGLNIPVTIPPGTDPPVSPWITGTREWSAWEWITDAAQEVLYIPYVTRLNVLTFRPWAVPLARGRTITDAELVDLTVVSDYSGQYSVIQARQDATTIVERALTPPPRYGARTYTRDEITIDPGGWAETVLADRGLPSLRWDPGSIRPLTADSLELIATLEAVERISLSLPDEDPALFISGIVTGGEVTVRGRLPDQAVWRFKLYLAGAANEPLIESGGEPTDYLLATGGGEFLYPST